MKVKKTNNYQKKPIVTTETGYLDGSEERTFFTYKKNVISVVERTKQFAYGVSFVLAFFFFSGSAVLAEPSNQFMDDSANTPEIRVLAAIKKFTGTKQVALAFTLPTSTWMYSNRIEIALGSIGNSEDTTAFISAGPLWSWEVLAPGNFFELGFSPTFLADTQFGSRNIGGHLHFSSSATIGHKFGQNKRSIIGLRIQHISNGGLNNTNPGLDSVGLSVSYLL